MSRARLVQLLVLLLCLDGGLALLLAWQVARPREVVVVPGAPGERVLLPGDPTAAGARRFALLFAIHLDNFTSATFPAQARRVRSLVAPDLVEMDRILERRSRLARGADLASSLFVNLDTVSTRAVAEGYEVQFEGLRRQYVGGRKSWEAPFRYRVRVRSVPPTAGNPYGLEVCGLAVEKRDEADR